jgi:hypothetical protein
MMCLWASYEKKYDFFFSSLKSMKKGVGSGSISKRYGSGDPDPHQNVTDPQHWMHESLPQNVYIIISIWYGLCLPVGYGIKTF